MSIENKAVICEKCGETSKLFHKCAKKDAIEASEPMVEHISIEKSIENSKGMDMRAGAPQMKKSAPKAAEKQEYARKMEIEAVKQMVDAPDNHEAVQDSEIKQIVETMQMMSEKMQEYEARIEQLEVSNVAAESAWVEMAGAVDKLESFAGGIRFERGAEPAKMDDLG